MSRLIKTEGFVIRIVPFQDHDLILTLFTAALGKVAAFAKGARRPRSRFGPEIDLLSRSEFILLDSKNIKPLREASLKRYFHALKENYDHLNSALHATRLLSRLVPEDQQDIPNLRLFSLFLQALDQKKVHLDLYELAFKLRLLDNFGTGPHLDNCIRCEKPLSPGWFSLERGGMVCKQCRTRSDVSLAAPVVQSLIALRTMKWETLERVKLNAKEISDGNQILDRFLAYHVQDR